MNPAFGIPLNYQELEEPFGRTIQELPDLAKGYHEALRPHMLHPWQHRPLEILVTDDSRLNAYATKDGNADYIVVHRGALERIYGTMLGLLSMPTFLPFVGNPALETKPRASAAGGFPPMPLLRRNENPLAPLKLAMPRDQDRFTVAMLLSDMALEFLVLHELGHVLAGHLELREALGLGASLSEFSDEPPRIGVSNLSHVLECDADAFASHLPPSIYTDERMVKRIGALVAPENSQVKQLALKVYLVATAVLFRAIYPKAPAAVAKVQSTHPHPAVRGCFVSCVAVARSIAMGRVPQDAMADVLGGSVSCVEQAWAEFCVPGQSPLPAELWAKTVRHEFEKLSRAYTDARALLEQHARLPRRWDNLAFPMDS